MRIYPLLIGCVLLLTACAPVPPPLIPDALLQPVPRPMRPVVTQRDAALLIVDYDEALGRANSQIEAIRGIAAEDVPLRGRQLLHN